MDQETRYRKIPRAHNKLRGAIAEHHNVGIDQILLTNGATGAIFAILHHIKHQTQEATATIATPEYFDAVRMLNEIGFKIETIERLAEEGFSYPIKAIIEKLKEQIPPSVLYISNPNNPTGAELDEEELQKIIEATQENTTIVIDQTLVTERSRPNNSSENIKIATIHSFSKSHGLVGERIGYIILTNLQEAPFHPFAHSPSLSSIKKALKVLKKHTFQKKLFKKIKKSQRIITKWNTSEKMATITPSNSNFAVINLPEGTSEDTIAKIKNELAEKEIIVKSGKDFSAKDNFIRVAMDNPKKLKRILKIIDKIIKNP